MAIATANLTLPQLIGRAIATFVRNPVPLLLLSSITLPLNVLGFAAAGRPWVNLLLLPSNFVVGAVTTGVLIYAVRSAITTRGPVPIVSSVRCGLNRTFKLVSTELLAGVLTFLSLVAFPHFLVRWWFAQQAVVIDDSRNWASLDASSEAVRGNWWGVAFALLTIHAIPLAYALVSLSFVLVGSPLALSIRLSATLVLSLVVRPIGTAADTLLFLQLRSTIRREHA